MPQKFLGTILLGLLPWMVGFTVSLEPSAQALALSAPSSIDPVLPMLPASLRIQATANISTYLPLVFKSGTASAPPLLPILESFENTADKWQVFANTAGSSSVQRSNIQAAVGTYSAHLTTSGNAGSAQIGVTFSEPAGNHFWQERPGTWYWQWAKIYLPSSTVARLGPGEYLTLAGLWPTNNSALGWWLRVKQGGALYVAGFDRDGQFQEFRVYGAFPQDRWVAVEIGLHSQHGPGVQRAFAFLIDGDFYGWYHQGRLANETYNRAAMGILSTNSPDLLELFVDEWAIATLAPLPGGVDNRSTGNLQEQDFRNQQGVQWQIDWSTWGNDLRLDPVHGLYSFHSRLQSGRNLDRMPDLTSGWAEIEIDWPKGTPPTSPNSYFGPMVGFRKEINREENLEIIPIGQGNGQVNLVFEAWVNGGPQIQAQWPMPPASMANSHIPEPGDIIRARWQQNGTQLQVRASYFDASTGVWHTDIINKTINVTNIGGVDFTDGYHTASSITIDSPYYSIRRFKVGTLESYPQ